MRRRQQGEARAAAAKALHQFHDLRSRLLHFGRRHRRQSVDVEFDRARRGQREGVLRLAVKGDRPIMRGGLGLTAKILVPPGPGAVADKLRLEGDFQLSEALFTDPVAQEGLDGMGRRAVGQPNNAELKNIPSDIQGTFRMGQGVIEFSKLNFQMPGALVDLTGRFVFATQVLDFHGTLKTEARVSQMMKARWKRLVLKPVDPFFSKRGAGTYLPVKISGSREKVEFGLVKASSADTRLKQAGK